MNHDPQHISQRDAFWNRVYELARDNRDIVIISADAGAPALDKFRKDLSGQFINTGIAEQNSILLSAGLALEGKKVFVTAIAPFITLRCYEQIRVDLAGMNLPVTIIGIGAGFSYDDSGPTHHAVEDLSIMRILPHMHVHTITDSVMADAFADISCTMRGPNYLRLDRGRTPDIYTKGDDFSSGLTVLRKSNDRYIVATGTMVHRALEVSDELKKHSIDVGVLDLYTLPINEKKFLEVIGNAKEILTLEEHALSGGMGSAVVEVLADNNKLIPVKRFGLDFKNGYCYTYGGRKHMQSLYGLDAESIVKAIREQRT